MIKVDLRNHLNVINNHGYDGYIARYTGVDQLTSREDDIVLVQNERDLNECDYTHAEIEWRKRHRVIEHPLSPEQIAEQQEKGSALTTWKTCVGVPLKLLERIYT